MIRRVFVNQIDLAHRCAKLPPSFAHKMNGEMAPKRSKHKKSGMPFDSSDEEEEEPEVFEEKCYEKLINRPDFINADTIVRMDAKGKLSFKFIFKNFTFRVQYGLCAQNRP